MHIYRSVFVSLTLLINRVNIALSLFSLRSDDELRQVLETPITEYLLESASIGDGHLAEAVRVSRVIEESGVQLPAVSSMASVGGADLSNVSRDLHNKFKPLYPLKTQTLWLKLKSWENGRVEDQAISCLAPYEVFAALFRYRAQFDKTVLGHRGPTACEDYWGELLQSDYGKTHPVSTEADLNACKHRLVPWVWHSDGSRVFATTEYKVFSWSSQLSTFIENILDQKIYILMVPEECLTSETLPEIMRWLKWNEEILKSRTHPELDFYLQEWEDPYRAALAGKPLASDTGFIDDSFGACFVSIMADLKEKLKIHKFPWNFHAHLLCEWCNAHTKSEILNPFDFRDEAGWLKSLVSHQEYLATVPEHRTSPLVDLPGWTIDRNVLDSLHAWWMGFAKDIAGTLMQDLSLFYCGDIDNGLQYLWWRYKAWCKQHKRRTCLKCFKPGVICYAAEDYPLLQDYVKAAHTRQLCQFLAAECIRVVEDGLDTSEYARMRASMMWHYQQHWRILHDSDLFMTASAAASAQHHGFCLLKYYQELAYWSYCEG
jgi:hypothetical protein